MPYFVIHLPNDRIHYYIHDISFLPVSFIVSNLKSFCFRNCLNNYISYYKLKTSTKPFFRDKSQ